MKVARNIFCRIVIIVFVLLTPLVSSADLADYSLAGSVWQSADATPISGNVTVNNNPTPWGGNNDTSCWGSFCSFHISSFSIHSEAFTFTGNSGDLIFLRGGLYPGALGPTAWQLDGTLVWGGETIVEKWFGGSFLGLNKDGTYNLDPNAYDLLAADFGMWGLGPGTKPDDPLAQGCTIVGSLQEASVPEPSTFLQMLCGVVLLSLAGWRTGIRVN